eukprot:gb/GECH01013319.1/.p1 GENE.gb/GECH01013319.1/~~gb/GECH01013319.1/.p1  ORF type:complete len:1019 (+),score=315.15 gb/GECH01013319.1/:1-3057(+)
MVELNKELFYSHLDKFYEEWKQNPEWQKLDAFAFISGKVDGDVLKKSEILQAWFLAYQFTDTLMVFCKDTLHILTAKKKAAILNSLVDSSKSIQLKIHTKTKEFSDSLHKITEEIKQSQNGKKLGYFPNESLSGNFANTCFKHFTESTFELEDVSIQISKLLAIKDQDELKNIKKAAIVTSSIMESYAVPKMEEHIIDKKSITHEEFAKHLDDSILEPKLKSLKKKKIDVNNLDLGFNSLIQSNGKFDFDANAAPDNNKMSDNGALIFRIGAKYKTYCSMIARTFFINPSKTQENNYELFEQLYQKLLNSVTPGKTLGQVASEMKEAIHSKAPDLEPYISDCFGFGIGINHCDTYLEIKEGNDVEIKSGMVFAVSLSAKNIPAQNSSGTYAFYLGDTGFISDKCLIVTQFPVASGEVCYTLSDSDDENKDTVKEDPLDTSVIRDTRTRQKKNISDHNEERRRQQQEEIMEKRREQSMRQRKKRKSKGGQDGDGDDSEDESAASKLMRGDIASYTKFSQFPKNLLHNRIFVDSGRDSVLFPINGTHVPFHVATIKNVSQSYESDFVYLRINFRNPTQIGQKYAPARLNREAAFVKELSYRSRNRKNMNAVFRAIQDMSKRMNQKDRERKERSNLVQMEPLRITRGGLVPRLTDVSVRPVLQGRKTKGNLEAHDNGLRFKSSRGKQLDILYRNIKHFFFQEAQNDPIVILHFHLYHPIMIGKKKHIDVQFFVEVIEDSEQVGGYAARMSEQDSFREEQKQRENKRRWNKRFYDFAKKVEKKSEENDEYVSLDVPYRQLDFKGTPNRSFVTLSPTVNCLISLYEMPFFVVTLDEIEIAHLERVSYGLKAFDLVFVFEGYQKHTTINSIPVEKLEDVKNWLTQVNIPYFQSRHSLVWTQLLNQIRKREDWDPWGDEGWRKLLRSEEDVVEEMEDEDPNDVYEPDESDYDPESEEYESDESFASDEEEDDDEIYSEDEDEDEDAGKSWEQLEKEAIQADSDPKKRALYHSDEESGPPKKRRRR